MMMFGGPAAYHLVCQRSPPMRRRSLVGKQPTFCSNLISTYSPMAKRTFTISPRFRQKQSPFTEKASSSSSPCRPTTISPAWKSTPLIRNCLFRPTSSARSRLLMRSSLGSTMALSAGLERTLKLSMWEGQSECDLCVFISRLQGEAARSECLDKMWWFWPMRAVVVLLWVAVPVVPTCLASFSIKGSCNQCSFHYAAEDQPCSDYRFTHCLYVNTTITEWLWIFTSETRQELVREGELGQCGRLCCKEDATLPTGLEGYQLCQQRKFQKEVRSTQSYQLAFAAVIYFIMLFLIAVFLYAIIRKAMRNLQLRNNTQQSQIRIQ